MDEDWVYEAEEPESERFHLDDLSVAPAVPVARVGGVAPGRGSASALRRELNERAFGFARRHGLVYDMTPTAQTSVVFGPRGAGHGNFLDATYRAILEDAGWAARLKKAHTAHRRVWPRAEWRWRELDAAASSDALLMNVFCYPGVLGAELRALLGVSAGVRPEFGYRPRIPLADGAKGRKKFDRTEIDLRLGSLLVEAKLTETATAETPRRLLERYPAFVEAFEPPANPTGAFITGYQLLRGVFAAIVEPGAVPASFCLLADARRPDLLEAWYAVVSTVRSAELRCRLQMLTWQEVSATLPWELREFLEEKYGIVSV